MTTQQMSDFKAAINRIDFNFQGVSEGSTRIYRVSVDSSAFKMMKDEEGAWHIWQQVPRWIKDLEPQLAEAILAHESN